MKAIILAAGYATRLYPLTQNKSKPLLPIAGKPIIEYILNKIKKVQEIDIIYIITNNKFYRHFLIWLNNFQNKHVVNQKIEIINDGRTTNENRLGSIGDICFVIAKTNLCDDTLVVAGDNLFDFELKNFIDYFFDKNSDVVCAYQIDSIEELNRKGAVQVNDKNRIIYFEEKPIKPESNIGVPAIHIYKKDTLKLFQEYLEQGNDPDELGCFIGWLYDKKPMYAYFFQGNRYHIGDMDSYEEIDQIFKNRS